MRLEGTLLPQHFVRPILERERDLGGAEPQGLPQCSWLQTHCPGEALLLAQQPLGTLGKRLDLSVIRTGPPTSQGDCKDHGQ